MQRAFAIGTRSNARSDGSKLFQPTLVAHEPFSSCASAWKVPNKPLPDERPGNRPLQRSVEWSGRSQVPGSGGRRTPADHGASRYDLFISQLVAREASGGDEEAAKERVAFLQSIPRLGVTDEAGELAAKLVESGAVPRKAAEEPFTSRSPPSMA